MKASELLMKASELLKRYAVGERNFQRVNLGGQSFKGQNLSGADFSGADFSEADIRGANFTDANLFRANLRKTRIDERTKLDRKWRKVWEIVNQGASVQNLRGADLSGADLSGADLSEANIRSTNFTNANLRGAKFCGAQCGLQKRWVILLLILSWLLAGISGFSSLMAAYLFRQSLDWLLVGFLILIICQGIKVVAVVIAIAIAGVVAFTVIFSGVGVLAFAVGLAGAGTLELAETIVKQGKEVLVASSELATAVAVAGAAVIGLAVVVAVAEAIAGTVGLAVAGILAVERAFVAAQVFLVTVVEDGVEAEAGIVVKAVVVAGVGVYIGWLAMKENKKDAWVRSCAIAFATIGGTSFQRANLTDADFTGAKLKSTDLRKATLTRVHWYGAKMLNRVRPGESYLKNQLLRQLLITGKGQDQNFDRLDLRGVNLQKANLENASFIDADFYQANLKGGNLKGAKLVRANLEQADLTDACLTGACIQDWSVARSTKLNGVKCKYIFMKFIDGDKRDQMPPKGEFKDGEFILFVRSILDTLDLYHEQDVNPRAAVIVLRSLVDDYQEPLEIVGLERRGNGIIIKLKTSEFANQEQLKQEYYSRYSQTLTLSMTDPEKILPSNEVLEAKVTELVEDVNKRPTTSIKYLYNEGLIFTGESPKVNIDQSKHQSINTGGGNIDARGTVAFNLADTISQVTATFNELPASTESEKPGIKELLTQLQDAIAADEDLNDEDKAEALEQVKSLAVAGKNRSDEGMKKQAKSAITMLKGIDSVKSARSSLVLTSIAPDKLVSCKLD